MSDEELIQRAMSGEVLGNGRKQIEALLRQNDLLHNNLSKRLAQVEAWIERRESYDSEQQEY